MYDIESIITVDDERLMVVAIDGDDECANYECYPVEIVAKAKEIMVNGGTVDCENDPDYCWVFDDYVAVLSNIFDDYRQRVTDLDILLGECKRLYAENEMLKAEIKKLKEDK